MFLCRRINFFFLSFSETKLIVEFKFRVLGFRVLFETLNFLYLSLSSKFKSARLFRRETRAVFLATLSRSSRRRLKKDAQTKVFSFVEIAFVKREASRFLSQSVYFSFATRKTTTLKKRVYVFSSKMRVSGERGEGDAFVSENRDDDDAKRKKKRKRRRENGGALEWKDIVAGTKKSEEDESFSHHHHSSDFEDQEEEEKEEKEEGTDLDALMKTVLAGRERKGKKMKTEEAFKKSRKREASRLKRELRNVNVKENNRNFERMFIGETLVDGVGRRRRATNTATSAGKMEDDTVEDDDETIIIKR